MISIGKVPFVTSVPIKNYFSFFRNKNAYVATNDKACCLSDLETAFARQVKEHELLLYKVCRTYACNGADRDDLYQEIVLQLWHAYPHFRGEARFSTWMYRVALNTAIAGSRRRQPLMESYEPDRLPSPVAAPGEGQEQVDALYGAIGRLGEIDKAIVMLYLEDKSYDEMEEIMGISSGTLRVKMTRIREKLRQLTKDDR